jgi:hypothetical protein
MVAKIIFWTMLVLGCCMLGSALALIVSTYSKDVIANIGFPGLCLGVLLIMGFGWIIYLNRTAGK